MHGCAHHPERLLLKACVLAIALVAVGEQHWLHHVFCSDLHWKEWLGYVAKSMR